MQTLFEQYCPEFRFHPNESYFPCNFTDLLGICTLEMKETGEVLQDSPTPSTLPLHRRDVLLSIDHARIPEVPLGTQVWCITNGYYSFDHTSDQYIDLQYSVIFPWNGTLASHAFDHEYVIVRVNVTHSSIMAVYGSSHGNGQWEKVFSTHEGRPIVYSALGSHAMYMNTKLRKRMFNFGNDVLAEKGRMWIPTEFVMCPSPDQQAWDTGATYGSPQVFTEDGQLTSDLTCIYYAGYIGNSKNNQQLATVQKWDISTIDGYYKYQGGIANLFDHPTLSVIPIWIGGYFIAFGSIIAAGLVLYNMREYADQKRLRRHWVKALFKLVMILITILVIFFLSFFVGLYVFVF